MKRLAVGVFLFRTIIVALIAAPVAYCLWQYYSLWRYQHFILQYYAPEITLLESSMLAWPESRRKDKDYYQHVEAIKATLKKTFNAGDFYCAAWSYDSHHGLRGTGLPDGGFGHFPVFTTTDASGHSLQYGRSKAGADLLVLQKWVPDAPVMGHFKMVLYRKAVDSRMASE